ncbi:MAG: YihY/virulence factor BrkB family protein [Candidatus Binatia bacterium]
MLAGLTLAELARRIWQEIYTHNFLGRAAELAYFFLLALFPMLIFLMSLISFMPGVQQTLLFWLANLMPPDTRNIVDGWVKSVFNNRSGGLLSFGLIFSLWAASNGARALMAALNDAYEVREWRPFWKSQVVAFGLTITLCSLVIGGALFITFGEQVAAWIANWLGLGDKFGIIWLGVRYTMGLVMLTFGIGLIYYVAPNVKQRWKWITPGTIFAVPTFVIASYLFSLYLRFAPDYHATYGSLGAVIILMLWLYLLGLILCVGGEINAEIHSAAGQQVVEKERPEDHEAG